jgi:hypothetical protein
MSIGASSKKYSTQNIGDWRIDRKDAIHVYIPYGHSDTEYTELHFVGK